ncbi:MAG: Maf family protein [Candidatus Peribacteraceae bacterium]|nr:Maf family protein [Candidatus Peribacteraceae bacterium]
MVLASASPQRKQLLAGLGVQFSVQPSAIDECICTEREPAKRAVALARMKALDIAASCTDAYVIGCDTLVVASDGTLLEKPAHAHDAREMLVRQSGSASIVHSGLCIVAPGGQVAEGLSSSMVLFKTLRQADIDWWLRSGLWQDRSGSFQIDGLGQLLIERVEGDWPGVVGLPVFLLERLFRQLGESLQS